MTDKQNIEIQTLGQISLSNQNLGRMAENVKAYAEARQNVENTQAGQTQAALGAQYQAQSGAVSAWQGQVTRGANAQANLARAAARESKCRYAAADSRQQEAAWR